jgi:hypothetical protein
MNRCNAGRSTLGAATLAALTLMTPAAPAAELLPPGFRACAAQPDRDRRLACFDAEVARLTSPAAKEQNFGTDTGALARQRAEQQADDFVEIVANVTSVVARPHGELIVTLDNGQVWSQTQANSRFTLQAGDSVKVKVGALSAYVLVAPSGRATKVTRTR